MLKCVGGFLSFGIYVEKQNASDFPSFYYAKHLETGLARYTYDDKDETILIDGDNLKNMIPSFIGKPVYVYHQQVDLANLKEQAHGYVTESFYNELDGWLWVKVILTDDEAKQAVANGWSVSNAYVVTEWSGGGMHHNVPYDKKVVNGDFTHLAIVPNPRYEEALILNPDEFKAYQEAKRTRLAELHNSKDDNSTEQKGKTMFKLFKNTKQEVTSIDADTMLEVKNDKGETSEVKISDMITAVLNAKKNEADDDVKKEEEKEKVNMDTCVTVGDEEMTIGELMNRYSAMNAKKNEAEEEETENADDKDEDDKKEKENAKDHFTELANARENAAAAKTPMPVIQTSAAMLKRGTEYYGS